MGQYNELPVYKAIYDLLLSIFQFTRDFNREYKYTVDESLKKETIELLTLIYRANSKYQKAEILHTAREQIEVIALPVNRPGCLYEFNQKVIAATSKKNSAGASRLKCTVVNY